ncbi:MAG: hypothetical protein H8E55_71290 [Pelagibacterales bacterium]|nr:hypothetical protein [Pelagibacterales bacterium]
MTNNELYINGMTTKVDVIQNVIDNIDSGNLASAKDDLLALKFVEGQEQRDALIKESILKAESDVDVSIQLEAESKRGK